MWKRVQSDLEGFLVVKGSQGIPTLGWYHRQFWEVAEERYLATEEDRKEVHNQIASYFEELWYNKEIYYFQKKTNTRKSALRYVAAQPFVSLLYIFVQIFSFDGTQLYDGGNVNYRKLIELPYHLLKLKDMARLVNLLCDFRFIQASFAGHKYFDLLGYYVEAIGIYEVINLCEIS